MTPNRTIDSAKVIEIQRRQIEETTWQLTLATARAETAELRLAELEAQTERAEAPTSEKADT